MREQFSFRHSQFLWRQKKSHTLTHCSLQWDSNTHSHHATFTHLHTRLLQWQCHPLWWQKKTGLCCHLCACVCVSVCTCHGRAVRVNSYSHIRQVTRNKRHKSARREDREVAAAACWSEKRRLILQESAACSKKQLPVIVGPSFPTFHTWKIIVISL